MGFIDLSRLTATELVTQFILCRRDKGFCLPYQEYALIDEWLSAADHDADKLLLILSDLIPEKREAKQGRRCLPLKLYHKKVLESCLSRCAVPK